MSLESVYRVDKFVVPAAALEEFMGKVSAIRDMLGAMPGCRQNLVLEQVSGPGEFNVVTFVEWESAAAFENAKASVAVRYKEMNFNPQETMVRLGIRADMANYGLSRPQAGDRPKTRDAGAHAEFINRRSFHAHPRG